jgi:DNA-binding IclR family transcriptional regulator
MFAALAWSEVEALHAQGLADWPTAAIRDLDALRAHLEAVREAGYAVNDGETKAGVVVVGASMQDDDGRPIAALTIAVPRDRSHTQGSNQTVAALLDARHACERALRAAVRT